MLAVLDALGLDRVKLVGHDWGGWIGFLLCLRAPERFERFLALNIPHPWQTLGGGWRQLPRFWYQQVIICPGLGYLLHRIGAFVRAMLLGGTTDRAVWDRPTLDAFADNLAEPARARACVQVYRTFAPARDRPAAPRPLRRHPPDRPHPRSLRHRRPRDQPRAARRLRAPRRRDDGRTGPLGCSHFIVDERPDLVADRARELFAG